MPMLGVPEAPSIGADHPNLKSQLDIANMNQSLKRKERFVDNNIFLPATTEPAAVTMSGDGPVSKIGDREIMIFDILFNVKVIQPGTIAEHKELKGKSGKLWIPDLGEFHEKLRLIPIGPMGRGRRLFPPYDAETKDLVCWSQDGFFPSMKVEKPISNRCAKINDDGYYEPECEKAQWLDGKRSACRIQVYVAMLEIDRLLPLKFQFAGTGLSSWNGLLRRIQMEKNVARIKGINPSDIIIELTTEDEGTYHRQNFKLKPASDDNPAQYHSIAEFYRRKISPFHKDSK